jgi:hypothetical protein
MTATIIPVWRVSEVTAVVFVIANCPGQQRTGEEDRETVIS